MNARKLLLSVLLGGPILGTLAGLAVDTTMQPAAEPSWRKVKPDVIFTSAGKQFVEAGPEDLDPARIARSTLLARRFAADADERGGRHGYAQYRVEPPAPLPEPEEAALPAEAAGKALPRWSPPNRPRSNCRTGRLPPSCSERPTTVMPPPN